MAIPTPKPVLTAHINLRKLRNVFLAQGHTDVEWDALWAGVKAVDGIDAVFQNGKEIGVLWATKTQCPIHWSYDGSHRPGSTRMRGCVCRQIRRAWRMGQ